MSTEVSPHADILNIAGQTIPGGLTADDFVTLEKAVDSLNDEGTPSGEGAHSVSLDGRYYMTITMLETCQYHRILMGLYKVQQSTPGASFPVFFRRPGSGEQWTDGAAVIKRPPEPSVSSTPGYRTWRLLLPDCAYDYI